eukprot:gene7887-8528_t
MSGMNPNFYSREEPPRTPFTDSMTSTHNKKQFQENPIVSYELVRPQPDPTFPPDTGPEPTYPVPMVIDYDGTTPTTPTTHVPEISVPSIQMSVTTDESHQFGVSIDEIEDAEDNGYMMVGENDYDPTLPQTITTSTDVVVSPTHPAISNDNNPTILPNQTTVPKLESTPSSKSKSSISYENLTKIVEATILPNPTLRSNPEPNPTPSYENLSEIIKTYSIDPFAKVYASLEKELNEWCEENNLPLNFFDVLKENQIQNIHQLNDIKDHVVDNIASQLKAIPAKKFRAAIVKLKQNPLKSKCVPFGELPKSQQVQSPLVPSSPSPSYQSINEPTPIQNEYSYSGVPYVDPYSYVRNLEEFQAPMLHIYGTNLKDPDSKTEYPKDYMHYMHEHSDEPEIGDSIIKATELGLSVDLLKEELKKEGEILENLIDLVTNKSDQFTPKALEVLNQSKLEHQERARRLKKIILDKKTKEEPVVAPVIPEESAQKREPAIYDPLLRSNSPIIRPPPLTFQPTVESYEIHDGQSYDQTKRYGQEKPILLVVKASLTMEKDEMLARRLQEQERIQDIESRKKKVDNYWTCTYCSRDNGHNLKCSDCFNEYRYALKVTPAQWQNQDYCLRCRYRIHPSNAPICSRCKSDFQGLLRVFVIVKNSHPIPHQQVPSSEPTRKQPSSQGQQRANHSISSTKSEYVAGYRCKDCLTAAVMLNTPCRTCGGRKYEPVFAKSPNEEVRSQPTGSSNGVGSGSGIMKFVVDLFVPSSSSPQYDVERVRVRQDQTYAEATRTYSSPKVLGSPFAYDYNKPH